MATLLCCAALARAQAWGPFASPQAVTIAGYPASAEEPFISPDGRYLLFNSDESMPDFSLRYASAVNAHTFEYQGLIGGEGVNDPEALSGTPTLDVEGELYFISTRSYFKTLSTVYGGRFAAGQVTGVHLVPGVSAPRLGRVDFDVGVSPDGSTLYVSEGQFGEGGGPTNARIVSFQRNGSEFLADPGGEASLRAVNETGVLDYAADLSYDGLELFFTAASPALGQAPAIYRATRTGTSAAFAGVERIAAISGFAEAPSISADGATLYYHEKVGNEVNVFDVTRVALAPVVSAVRPKSGHAAGGTSVLIKGAHLAGASAVKFGSIRASSFTVDSESAITAVSPPGSRGTVDVTVSTHGGASAPSGRDHFRYRR
jgi:IPT/TIG domain-containing protein/WD40 repeat protein